jgi:serine/threonine protein kinase
MNTSEELFVVLTPNDDPIRLFCSIESPYLIFAFPKCLNAYVEKVDLTTLISLSKSSSEINLTFSSHSSIQILSDSEKLDRFSGNLRLSLFQIGDILGIGSSCEVRSCVDMRTQKKNALKFVPKEHLKNKKIVKYFLNERNILMKINHPFILKMEQTFQTETHLIFVLEFMQHGDLWRHRNICFTHQEIQLFSAEIILALHHLHSNGIIHRDVKLENILVSETFHLKLGDFSLAKENDKAHSFCGSDNYLAPEILKGEEYSFPVDYWSLGILLFYLFFKKFPFSHPSDFTKFQMIRNKQLTFPTGYFPEVNESAKDLLQKLLEKDPKKRIKFEEIQVHPFFSGLNWEDVLMKKYSVNVKFEEKKHENSPFVIKTTEGFFIRDFSSQNLNHKM